MVVSDQIIEILEYLGKKLGVTIDWTGTNVLPYVKELGGRYIHYEIATSIVWLIFGLALIFFGIWIAKKIYKGLTDDEYDGFFDDEDICCIFSLFVFVIITSGIIVSYFQIMDIIKCILIPEAQIYDYLQHLIQSMS